MDDRIKLAKRKLKSFGEFSLRWGLWFAVLVCWAWVLVYVDKNSARYAVLQDNVATILIAVFIGQWINSTIQAGGLRSWRDAWQPPLGAFLVLLPLALTPLVHMISLSLGGS